MMDLPLGVPLCEKQLRLLPVEPDPTSIGVGMSVVNVYVLHVGAYYFLHLCAE
jgi:hypothetical protein